LHFRMYIEVTRPSQIFRGGLHVPDWPATNFDLCKLVNWVQGWYYVPPRGMKVLYTLYAPAHRCMT
jgi:hypothetical protein